MFHMHNWTRREVEWILLPAALRLYARIERKQRSCRRATVAHVTPANERHIGERMRKAVKRSCMFDLRRSYCASWMYATWALHATKWKAKKPTLTNMWYHFTISLCNINGSWTLLSKKTISSLSGQGSLCSHGIGLTLLRETDRRSPLWAKLSFHWIRKGILAPAIWKDQLLFSKLAIQFI